MAHVPEESVELTGQRVLSASPLLIVALLLTFVFTSATQLTIWREQSPRQRTPSGNMMEILMGDSRRLFANHFVTKADAYLHSGVYPSIFDRARAETKSHLAAAAETSHDAHADHAPGEPEEHDAVSGFLGKPHDWIDAFGRNFIPTQHVHLGEKGNPREILPWLRMAAELNPNQAEIYPLGAYWLREHMGQVKEAEDFLHEGWRANPDSFEIMFELGRLNEENRKDDFRARNLFEAALRKWRQSEGVKKDADLIPFRQIVGHLARLEERQGRLPEAIAYLETLRPLSPRAENVQRQIDDLTARLGK